MTEHSVEEVRAHASFLRDCRINTDTTRDKQQDKLADMLTAFADLREQIERAREGVTMAVASAVLDAYQSRAPVEAGHSQDAIRFGKVSSMRAALLSVAHLLPSELIDIAAVREVIPTNWLDPLLTGPNAVIGEPPYGCQDIERLLRALSDKLTAALPKETP